MNILETIKRVLQEEGEKEELGMLLVEIFEREEKGEIGYQWKRVYQEAVESRIPFFKQRSNSSNQDEG